MTCHVLISLYRVRFHHRKGVIVVGLFDYVTLLVCRHATHVSLFSDTNFVHFALYCGILSFDSLRELQRLRSASQPLTGGHVCSGGNKGEVVMN